MTSTRPSDSTTGWALHARTVKTSLPGQADTYRILANGKGGYLHLTDAVEGWLVPGRNPFGLYLYLADIDALAREFRKSPEHKPWGMYEFAVSDPDETLVRVGWPSHLREPR